MVEEKGSSRGNREDRGISRGNSWSSNEDKSSHGGRGTGSSTPKTPRLQRTTAKKDRVYNADSTFEFEDDSLSLRSPGRSPIGSESLMRQQSFRVGDYEGDLDELYKLLEIGSPAELGIKASDWEARKSQFNSRPTSPSRVSQDSGQSSSDEFKGFQQPASFDSSAGSPPFSPVVPSSRPIEREWKAHRTAVMLQPVNRYGHENKLSPPPPTAFPQYENSTGINRASSGTPGSLTGRVSLTRSDGLDRRHSEPIHVLDLPTSPQALPSPSDGGVTSPKLALSDQGEYPAKRRPFFDGADLPTAAVAVSSVSRRSCMKDSLQTKSGGSIRWKSKDALEVESPANLVDEISVGSRPANSEDSESREHAFVAETVEEPLTPSSVTSMESFGRSLSKKPSWSTWEKGEFLGSGTFGTVYEGVSSDGMFFAVKEVSLSDQGKTGKQAIRQLEQEIELLSEIEHPNIVQYLGTERDDEKLYIFLELVSKGSLAHVYEKYFVRYDQVRAYTKQILSGLKYLHDRKIIHRDIKCANILVDTSGVVKLADFGMAKQVDNLGRLKSFLGSAHWMAPEVINPKRSYNLMADIWSLGCTVLEMAIGKPPFGELEAHGVLWKVGHGEGPPIPDDLEDDLKSFINNCLVVNAAERPTCDLLMTHPFITGAPMNGPVMLVSTNVLMPSIAEERSIDMSPSAVSSTAASSEVPASPSMMSNIVNNHGSSVRQQPKSMRKIRSEFSMTSQEASHRDEYNALAL